MPESGWFHRAVGAVRVRDDLILVQYQELGAEVGARDNLATELHFIRPTDGAQARVTRPLPTIAHVGDGFAWAWRNVPFPQVVRMGLDITSH